MRTRFCLAAFALVASSLSFAGDSWPGFRGPTADGHAPGKNVPTQWSEKENVRWKTAIHGKGHSSPVVLGNQVWVTTADEVLEADSAPKKGGPPANPVKEITLFAVCVDRTSGKVFHDIKLRVDPKPVYCHPFNTYASPTPFVEDGRLYAFFGSHGTFCVDTASGKVLWERTDLKSDHYRGPGSSPVVHGDLLYLIFDGFDLQYVTALDKKTGNTVWKTDRKIKYSSDNGDFKKAYATPAVFTVGGKEQLVCPSAECTMAYDPKTGDELWRLTHGGMNGAARPVMAGSRLGLDFLGCRFGRFPLARPVVSSPLMYLNSGHTGKLFALRADGLKGEVAKDAVAWQVTKYVPSRPSLLLANELLFLVSDNGLASCLEAATGKAIWNERFDGEFSASPVLAGGNVYFCNQIGKTFVVKADKEFNIVAENRLDGGFMASPAVVGDDLFLRTKTHLYAIGKK